MEGAGAHSPVRSTNIPAGGCWSSPIATRRRMHASRRRSPVVRASSEDAVIRSLAANREVAVLTAVGTNVVAEATERHNSAHTASAALGRVLIGTLLLGCFKKDEEVTQVTFTGDGPVRLVQAIADDKGLVRGRLGSPSANLPLRGDGKLDVGALVGRGVVTVVRSGPLRPKPYSGIVPITTGEVAEDLATYLAQSEQINSALALGVGVNKDGNIRSAGGFLIQVLPNASDETLDQLEITLGKIPTVTDMIQSGVDAKEMAELLMEGIGVGPGPVGLTPRYGPCDPERLKSDLPRVLAALGEDDVLELLKERGNLEARDEFCNECHQFGEAEVLAELEKFRRLREDDQEEATA